jgi:hypothetical protein
MISYGDKLAGGIGVALVILALTACGPKVAESSTVAVDDPGVLGNRTYVVKPFETLSQDQDLEDGYFVKIVRDRITGCETTIFATRNGGIDVQPRLIRGKNGTLEPKCFGTNRVDQ